MQRDLGYRRVIVITTATSCRCISILGWLEKAPRASQWFEELRMTAVLPQHMLITLFNSRCWMQKPVLGPGLTQSRLKLKAS